MNQGLTVNLVLISIGVLFLAAFSVIFEVVRHSMNLEQARNWAAIIAPVITFLSLFVAGYVAYKNLLTPFDPVTIARPAMWRLAPHDPNSHMLEIVMFVTVSNKGAVSGTLDDLAIQIEVGDKKWVLEAMAFVKPAEYFDLLISKEDNFVIPKLEGPFTPLFLNGKSLVTKAVMFSPFSRTDFDPSTVIAGQHKLTLFARFNGEDFVPVKSERFILEDDHLDLWRGGHVIKGMLIQRDKPTRDHLNSERKPRGVDLPKQTK